MWCSECKARTKEKVCKECKKETQSIAPLKIHWCKSCKVPILVEEDKKESKCNLCLGETRYLTTDLRVVFPEERY